MLTTKLKTLDTIQPAIFLIGFISVEYGSSLQRKIMTIVISMQCNQVVLAYRPIVAPIRQPYPARIPLRILAILPLQLLFVDPLLTRANLLLTMVNLLLIVEVEVVTISL